MNERELSDTITLPIASTSRNKPRTTILIVFPENGITMQAIKTVPGIPKLVIEWLPESYALCPDWFTSHEVWELWAWSEDEALTLLDEVIKV